MVKGFSSSLKGLLALAGYDNSRLPSIFATLQELGSGKVGLDTVSKTLAQVSSGNTVELGTTQRIIVKTAHGARKGDVLRFTNSLNIHVEAPVFLVPDANTIILGHKLDTAPVAAIDQYRLMRYVTPTTDLNGNTTVVEGQTSVVDNLDLGAFAPTGGNLIPRSSNPPLQIVAALAGSVTRIQPITDIGEFANLYSDAAGLNLIAHMTLTPDEVVDVDLAAGTSIYIRASKDADIDQAGSILSMNLIG